MMGLYQLKEFLTLDDVADYLRDKGVYNFDLSNSYDQQRLYDFIKELYQTKRVTPVFFHGTGSLKKHDAFDLDKDIRELKGDAYFICTNDMVKDFLKGLPSWLTFGDDYSKPFFRLYKDTSPYFLYVPKHIFDDEQIEVLFPKSELDALFNAKDDSQQQLADLQAENAHLQERITQLESQLNQANTTPTIKHTNQALQALHDVLVTHWQDYDPSQPKTRPKQDFIKAWIVENYPEIEPSKALWIDKIIRHGTHD